VDWFVTTLIKTPGHAPADTVASASVINQIQMPGGVAQVTQQLIEARRKDPDAQLFPEITVSTIGQDYMRAGEPKSARGSLFERRTKRSGAAARRKGVGDFGCASGPGIIMDRHGRIPRRDSPQLAENT
jgi:hypothetical protein